MSRIRAWCRALLLIAVIATPMVSTACAVRARVNEPREHRYHDRDSRDRGAYMPYRERTR